MVDHLVPEVTIEINGRPLPIPLRDSLRWIEIQQSVRLVDMASLCFDNSGAGTSEVREFAKGNEIKIELGYVGLRKWAFKGDIVSLEPRFPVAGQATVQVRAYDRLHRYRRGRKHRTFTGQTVKQVVEKLAGEEGLSPDVEDTKVIHDYLLQNNQTNIDFIHELGRRNGFEVEVTGEGKTLFFRKPRIKQGRKLELDRKEGDLKSFYVRKSLANVPTEVQAVYWNMAEKKPVVQKHDTLDDKLKATRQAPQEAKKAFGAATLQVSLRPNTAPAEALALARSLFVERALAAVRGRGTCVGNPKVIPGIVLELTGLGKTWSGLYYVTGVTHLLHQSSGYSTEFEVHRTGSGYTER